MDFDAEGGDDIMVGTVLPTHRFEGMLGFDWVTYRGEVQAVDADMLITGAVAANAPLNELRDRFDLAEGLSGTTFDDLLRGDNRLAADLITDVLTGVVNGHVLNAQGIARIDGLANLLPPGTTSWAEGNIILGGLGNDLIEGRGGNDRIDGDAWLNVQLRAVMNDGTIRLANSLHELKNDVFATPPRLSVNNISFVRSIVLPDAADRGTSDVAVFTGPQSEYTVTRVGETVIVDHGAGVDGVDTLTNIELLRSPTGGSRSAARHLDVEHPGAGQRIPSSRRASWPRGGHEPGVRLPGGSRRGLHAGGDGERLHPQRRPGGPAPAGDPELHQRRRGAADHLDAHGAGAGGERPAHGLPTIDDTTPAVGQTLSALTAAIGDADGLGPFSYQWLANDAVITGATGVTFIPTTAGVTLRVRVSWVDQQGFAESLVSAATSPVTNAPAGGGTTAAIVGLPTSLDFGAKRLNTNNVRRVDVTNTGTAPLTVTGVVSSGAPFTITGNTCTAQVAPGRRCRIDITFRPAAATLYGGTVTVTSNAVNSPTVMNVTGSGR